MLTVLKSPPLVALTGNSVRFRFQTDNHLEEAGEKILFTLQFTNGGTGFEDDWIELRWNGRTVRLVYNHLRMDQVHRFTTTHSTMSCTSGSISLPNQYPSTTIFPMISWFQ